MEAASSYHTSAAPALRKPTPSTTTTANATTSTITMASSAFPKTRRVPPAPAPVRECAVRDSVTGGYRLASSKAWSINSRPDATSCANSS